MLNLCFFGDWKPLFVLSSELCALHQVDVQNEPKMTSQGKTAKNENLGFSLKTSCFWMNPTFL